MNYKTIRRNFEKGLWSEPLVKMAVRKGLITQAQCDEILSGAPATDSSDAAINEAIAILNGEDE